MIHFLRVCSGALGRLTWTCGLTRTWGRTRPPSPKEEETEAGMDTVDVLEDFLASGFLEEYIKVKEWYRVTLVVCDWVGLT